jgi:hypothetical protein
MVKLLVNQSYRAISSGEQTPKGPALDVCLSDCSGKGTTGAFALIDTGADITFASWTRLKELESRLGHSLPRQGVRDAKTGRIIFTYVACLVIGDQTLVPELGICCPSDELFGLEEVLIGRDIQKQLVMMLNGPDQTFDIEIP